MKNLLLFVGIIVSLQIQAKSNDWLPVVADGFSISVYAEVENARQLSISEDGTVFVGTRKSGKVWAIKDSNGDGFAETQYLIASGLNLPSGIVYRNGDLFISEVHQISRISGILKKLKNPPKAKVIFSELPDKSHHGWKYIDFDSSGNLFVPVGAPCNICNPDNKTFAHLRKINLETGEWQVIATGIRNTVGFDWHPITGKLWFSDNGRDWMGDDKPADELNRIDKIGQHFGYPFVHGKDLQDPEFYSQKPKQLKITPPQLELQAHVAPLGIHFYTGKQFPEKFQNQLLVAQHGSWNRTKKVGFQVILVTIDKDEVISSKPFITGFREGEKALGRPVAFAELDDGSLLVSDDYSGRIYRIIYNSNLN